MTQLKRSVFPCVVCRTQTLVMIRSLRWGTVVNGAAMLALLGVAFGCGMRGPPLPPLVFVPGSVTNLEIERVDNEVFITLEVPSVNSDGIQPADLDRLEVYGLTTQVDPNQPVFLLPLTEWLEYATLVATIVVEQSDGVMETDVEVETGQSQLLRQGEEVTVVESLTPEVVAPVLVKPEINENEEEQTEFGMPVKPLSLVLAATPPPPRRTYVVVGVSTQGRQGLPSERLDITLGGAATAPGAPTITYTETVMSLKWVAPRSVRLPIQELIDDSLLLSEPIVEWPDETKYFVYAVSTDGDSTAERERIEPLNVIPTVETSYLESGITFGSELCFSVRALDEIDSLPVQGPASPSTCVTPVDTFAPEPPVGLLAVASQDAISLAWDPSPEVDISGYLVLRRTDPGATLQPLTPEPITETTFRDVDIRSDQRYVYAVQAVDNAIPPNISLPSLEIREQAR